MEGLNENITFNDLCYGGEKKQTSKSIIYL